MENMKMADIWGWDSIPQNYGHYEAFTFNGADRKGDFYGFLFCTEEAAEGTAHALRNHDQLVEENAELREMLEKFIPSNDYYETNEDDEDVYCNHGGTFEYNEDSEHIGLEVVKLLNK